MPGVNGVATWVMTNSSATAISVSGSTKLSSIVKLAPDGSRPRHRSMPSAKATPSGTVTTVASRPSQRVWVSAVCSEASCHTERTGSP